MGVDYIINCSCPVKESLGYEETFNMIKTSAQFDFLRSMMGQPGYEKLHPLSDIRYQVLNNGRFEQKNATFKEIERYLEPFRKLQHHCIKCEANLPKCPGGCWGYISYPIRPFVESFFIWAVEYIIDLEINKPSGLLIKYIIENGLKPDIVPGLRKQGHIELAKPLEYKWGKLITKKKVDTDQVLEMLFGFRVDSGSALVIYSFLNRCRDIFPQWLSSFVEIVTDKNQELTEEGVSQEITQTMTPYFQYGDSCFYAFNSKQPIVVLP